MYTPRMNGLRHFSGLYRDQAEHPEMAIVYRYSEHWMWSLSRRMTKIDRLEKECNVIIANIEGCSLEKASYTVLDYHQVYAKENHPGLEACIEKLEKENRRYAKDVLLAQAMANLPSPSRFFAERLAATPNLLLGGKYGPTGKDAEIYRQSPSHHGLAALKAVDEQDPIVEYIIGKLEPASATVNVLLRKLPGKWSTSLQAVKLRTIRTVMNVFTCFFAPSTYVLTMVTLYHSPSMKLYFVTLLCYAIFMPMSMLLLVPAIKPSELFIATINFCAFAGAIIGTRGANSFQNSAA